MPRLCSLLFAVLLLLAPSCTLAAQQPLPSAVVVQGLRSVQHRGAFKAAAFLPDGNAVLLFDQGDGLRLLKTDPTLSLVLAEAQQGGGGDTGVALALDRAGNVYVGGTSSSGQLAGTSGAPFSSPADRSLNSFVARFDSDLHLVFLSFLGAERTALTGIAATDDAVFATGVTFSQNLPVTPGVVQPRPAPGTTGNGFVVRFSTAGALQYATYLTGPGGSTNPVAVAADSSDRAFVTGGTSSPGFPCVAPLEPSLLGVASGFVLKLSPAGDQFLFSTFIPGSGLGSLALDPESGALLLTGEVSPGEFPVANAFAPLAKTRYQTLLRLSADGQNLIDSALLFPGTQSAVTPGPGRTAWITGSLTAPITDEQANAGQGDSFLIHLSSADLPDGMVRLGGHASNHAAYAHLTSQLAAAALNASGTKLLVAGTLLAHTDPLFLADQRFDLPLQASGSVILPQGVADLLPPSCTSGQPCEGTGGLLALLTPPTGQAAVSLSPEGLPGFLIRNLSQTSAERLSLAATGYSVSTNCPARLGAQAQCGALLSGAGPGTLTLGATNAPTQVVSVAALPPASPPLLAVDTPELNFGLVTADTSPITRTVTVSNLGTTPQTFSSLPAPSLSRLPYQLTESSSNCAGPATAHTLDSNASCAVTLALAASSPATNDTQVTTHWTLASHDLPVTAFTQATALALSSAQLVFSPRPPSASGLPRFLYLSNASLAPVPHTTVHAPANSPFTVNDDCPSLLEPQSVCQIGVFYLQPAAPALDSLPLELDAGLSVLLQGETTAEPVPTLALPDSPLLVSPATVQFTANTLTTQISVETQVVQITNPTTQPLPLNPSVLGDFDLQNTCPATLAAGATCDLGLRFAPSRPGLQVGLLTLASGSGTAAALVPLTANAAPLLNAGLGPLDLGETPVSKPVVSWLHLPVPVTQLSASISGPGFGVALLQDDGNGHGTLPATGFSAQATASCVSCWLGVQFLPTAAGFAQGTLHLTSNPAGHPFELPVQAVGLVPQGLQLRPTRNDFGALPLLTSSAPLTLTLTNLVPDGATATLQQIALSGDFHLLQDASPLACTPGPLSTTTSCRLQIVFVPAQTGVRSGTVTVSTSAGTVVTQLTGIGTPNPGLALSPNTLALDGTSPGILTLTNTGPAPLDIAAPRLDNSDFQVTTTCASLLPGQSCTAQVSLLARSPASFGFLSLPVTATDSFGESFGTTYAVALRSSASALAAGLTLFPGAADFGAGPTSVLGQVRQFTLTNSGATTQILTLAAARNFPLAGPSSCGALAPGASCTFFLAFAPEIGGPLSGSLIATSTAQDGTPTGQIALPLEGYGQGPGHLAVSAQTSPEAPLGFGQVGSGQSALQTLVLTNTGMLPVTFRRLTSTVPFQAATTCTAPLAPAASCTVTLTYHPVFQIASTGSEAPRTDVGTVLLESDAASSAETVFLSGSVAPSISTNAGTSILPTYTLSAGALTFPNTAPGTRSATQTLTVANTGPVPVTFSAVLASSDFTVSTDCAVLAPNDTCSIQAAFAPSAGPASPVRLGALSIQSTAAYALETVTLLGSATNAPILASTTSLDFGSVLLGATRTLPLTFTNATTLPVAFGQIVVSAGFTYAAGSCPPAGGALLPGASCTAVLTFAPPAIGLQTGQLTLTSPAFVTPLAVTLTGTGVVGHLQAGAASLTFGTVQLHTTASQNLLLSNTGTAPLTGIQATLAGSQTADFALGDSCTGAALLPGASCSLQLSFTPSQSGPRSASLTVSSSDPAGPLVIPVTGTGSMPPGFTLSVSGASGGLASILSGGSARFGLLVTPQGGFADPVALRCTALAPAPNSQCSLSSPQMSLAAGPATGSAILSTRSGIGSALLLPLGWLLLSPWSTRRPPRTRSLLRVRRILRTTATRLLVLAAFALSGSLLGCGGGFGIVGSPYTPPGTYRYQVTATSVTGPAITSSVTLTVTVQ